MLLVSAGALLVCAFVGYVFWRVECVAAGYKAKILCSGLFVSHRDRALILSEELDSRFPLLRTVAVEIDRERRRVTARVCGVIRRTAVFRPGLGSTLLVGPSHFPGEVRIPSASDHGREVWPGGYSAGVPVSVDTEKLDRVLDEAFEEPEPERPRRTRAVVVVYDGTIIGERYGPGITRTTPVPGWSMAKSVLGALIGICIGQGRLGLEDRELLPEWAAPDPRADITVDHLLRMRSGLEFHENYRNPLRGVLPMLFDARSAAHYASTCRLRDAPGSRWYYSSGTINILAQVLRNAVGDREYLTFPRTALFDRIGMSTAVMETDASGTFVGSSFMYASARDWARFGLLYAHDGLWNGQRILPEGWVAYSSTPAPGDTKAIYGAHFWLQLPHGEGAVALPSLPGDLFHARGYDGQYLIVIPSRRLVIVRLGLTPQIDDCGQHGLVAGVLGAIASCR